jgi:hypothetical protein
MAIRRALIAITALGWGCAPGAVSHELDLNHPANAQAPEGQPLERSTTLAIGDAHVPESQRETEQLDHGRHSAHRHQGHGGHGQ